MSLFTPLEGLIGGAMIGLAADVLLLFNGDIMGASGIISSVFLSPRKTIEDASQHWKLVFLASFLSTTSLFLAPRLDNMAVAASAKENARALSPLGFAVAGALVGFGTKLGNGCTSGHGICGLARLSRRSFVAVMTFMATGILTTILTSEAGRLAHYTEFLRASSSSSSSTKSANAGLYLGAAALVAALVAPFLRKNKKTSPGADNKEESRADADAKENLAKLVPAGVAGSLFASGLLVSTMCVQGKVLGFLDVSSLITREGSNKQWDPTLMCVMGGGVLVSALGYQLIDKFRLWKITAKTLQNPLCCKNNFASVPTSRVIDWQLVTGAAFFGVGWGTAGYCPGPAAFMAAAGELGILTAWWPAFFVGSQLANEIKNRT